MEFSASGKNPQEYVALVDFVNTRDCCSAGLFAFCTKVDWLFKPKIIILFSAPNLKGRPRKKRWSLQKGSSKESDGYESNSESTTTPPPIPPVPQPIHKVSVACKSHNQYTMYLWLVKFALSMKFLKTKLVYQLLIHNTKIS